MRQFTISTVVLTRDSETTIERTLKSLTWCDEIIVIDDQSSDETVVIAKKFGALYYHRPYG